MNTRINNRVVSAVLYSMLQTIEAKLHHKISTSFNSEDKKVVVNIEGFELASDVAGDLCEAMGIAPKRLKLIMGFESYYIEHNGIIHLEGAIKQPFCRFDYLTYDKTNNQWRYFWQALKCPDLSKDLFDFINQDANLPAVRRLIEGHLNLACEA